MKRFLSYDLETTFLQKGQKRPSQRILELALYTRQNNTREWLTRVKSTRTEKNS